MTNRNEFRDDALAEIRWLEGENSLLTDALANYEQENARLRNDLADALDIKAGAGPTVLSAVVAERDRLREALAPFVAAYDRAKSSEAWASSYLDNSAWPKARAALEQP